MLQNCALTSIARGSGAQRCLQWLLDARVLREPNDAPVAFPMRRRRVASPPQFFIAFLRFPRTRLVAPDFNSARRRRAALPSVLIQCLSLLRAHRRVRRAPHPLATCSAAPPRNFIPFLKVPQTTRRVASSLQLRVNLNLYSIFKLPANSRRVPRAPHVSAARSRAPAA
ncbi:hypothetical protein DFH09DRAFT_351917 [Mycena vulgaris]|nr:hypothetical protein DFH09DRAFT_351917 [Mycena vulgaris]